MLLPTASRSGLRASINARRGFATEVPYAQLAQKDCVSVMSLSPPLAVAI